MEYFQEELARLIQHYLHAIELREHRKAISLRMKGYLNALFDFDIIGLSDWDNTCNLLTDFMYYEG